jgi:hypothetical protein
MPWQTVPSLLIIVGAFNAAAGLIYTVDYLHNGKVGAPGGGCVGTDGLMRRPSVVAVAMGGLLVGHLGGGLSPSSDC